MSFLGCLQNKSSSVVEWALQACNLERVKAEEIDPPPNLQCSISQSIMKDPVEVIHTQTGLEMIRNVWRWVPFVNRFAQPLARHVFDRQYIQTYLQQQITAGRNPSCPLCRREISTNLSSAEDLKREIGIFLGAQPALRDLITATSARDFETIIQARGLQRFIRKKTKQLQQDDRTFGVRHVYTGSGINQLVRQEELPQPINPLPFLRNIQQFTFCIEERVTRENNTTNPVVTKRTEKHLFPINPLLIEREFRQSVKGLYYSHSVYLTVYIASVILPALFILNVQPDCSKAFSNILSDLPYLVGTALFGLKAIQLLQQREKINDSMMNGMVLSYIIFSVYQMAPVMKVMIVAGSYVRLLGFVFGTSSEALALLARQEPIVPHQ